LGGNYDLLGGKKVKKIVEFEKLMFTSEENGRCMVR